MPAPHAPRQCHAASGSESPVRWLPRLVQRQPGQQGMVSGPEQYRFREREYGRARRRGRPRTNLSGMPTANGMPPRRHAVVQHGHRVHHIASELAGWPAAAHRADHCRELPIRILRTVSRTRLEGKTQRNACREHIKCPVISSRVSCFWGVRDGDGRFEACGPLAGVCSSGNKRSALHQYPSCNRPEAGPGAFGGTHGLRIRPDQGRRPARGRCDRRTAYRHSCRSSLRDRDPGSGRTGRQDRELPGRMRGRVTCAGKAFALTGAGRPPGIQSSTSTESLSGKPGSEGVPPSAKARRLRSRSC